MGGVLEICSKLQFARRVSKNITTVLVHRFLPNSIIARRETAHYLRDPGVEHSYRTQIIKRTSARAVCPTFNLSAARETLVVVLFAIRAAHRHVFFITITWLYTIKQKQSHGCNATL